MNTKLCLKCGHSATYSGTPPESCPSCGAIYAKVEAAFSQSEGPPSRLPPAARAASSRRRGSTRDVHAFTQTMRQESLYPAWRTIVGACSLLGYLFAALIFIGGLVAIKQSWAAPIAGAALAAVVAFIAKMMKEMWLMLADLSDASVRIAAAQERQD